MLIVIWVLVILAVYFLIVFVGLRLVVPFMGFGGYKPPTDLPTEIKNTISELENQSRDQMSYLQAAYGFVLGRWEHSRFKAATQLHKLFRKDLKEIWNVKGFIYCPTINFLVYTLLANSKFFKAGDVKVKHVFLNFVPHQYLQVRVGSQWIDVDPAGTGIRGKPLGQHLSFFG